MNRDLSRQIARDLNAGVVVFLVALPLCLGVALASGTPLISGIIAGIVGGLIVGAISGSNTSVSGPAAGLTAIVAAQLDKLESFQQFLLVVVLAGILQVLLGVLRAGTLSAFFPSAVIKGLLAAIGVILILKQIPHILGHDNDPEGEMSFEQPDHENTFSEIGKLFAGEIHQGALVIGLLSLLVLVAWDSFKFLKKTPIPVPLLVVFGGVLISQWFSKLGGEWVIGSSHLVEVPVANQLQDLAGFFQTPDWSGLALSAVYFSAITTALVASLETLLNLEAIDKIDPQQRLSPPNRELVAQGIGNITCGLIGGIPVTSVIVRSSVNINAGARTKLSTLIHGGLLALSVAFLPTYLNLIPLSCLAAILLATGFKLISPSLIMKMYREGYKQFVPFLVTTIAIVLTDLIVGVGIGLAVSIAFILQSNIRTPISQVSEKYFDNDVTHIQLANQVSFLNRVALENALTQAKPGQHLLLDARNTDYIDPDILSLLRDYIDKTAPIRRVLVSTKGFKKEFNIPERILFGEYTTKELQEKLSPTEVLAALSEGNKRFLSGQRLTKDLGKQISGSTSSQYPLAVILSCIDSRSPAEILFDVGLGDIFTIRIAGNVVRSKVLGSLEYACAIAGARLVLVMGHTRCGAVTTAVELAYSKGDVREVTGCQHLELIVNEIQTSVLAQDRDTYLRQDTEGKRRIVDEVARRNVIHAVKLLPEQSLTLSDLVAQKRIAIVGALYDVVSGEIDFLMDEAIGLEV